MSKFPWNHAGSPSVTRRVTGPAYPELGIQTSRRPNISLVYFARSEILLDDAISQENISTRVVGERRRAFSATRVSSEVLREARMIPDAPACAKE